MHSSITTTKIVFEKRIDEIERYFNVLEVFDIARNSLEDIEINYFEISSSGKEQKVKNIDYNTSWTINGALILLLYNLIERTIRELISKIYEEVENHLKKHDINTLSDKIKEQIWQRFSKNITPDSFKTIIDNWLNLWVFKIIWDIDTNWVVSYYNFSGNVDPRLVKEIGKKIGFSWAVSGIDPNHILEIKTHRNLLAHWNK